MALAAVLAPTVALADAITYAGNSGQLQTLPAWAQGGGAPQSLFPGATASPLASGNSVIINFSSGTQPNYVYGGLSQNGDVQGNLVRLEQGNIRQDVYGAYTVNGAARGNAVEIVGGSIAGGDLVGARSENGSADGNTVRITGASVNAFVRAGWAPGGSARDNRLIIASNSVMAGWVWGGHAGSGSATGNQVFIADSVISGPVRGGFSEDGNATGNTVFVSGSADLGFIYGGGTISGAATRNTVSISGNGVVRSDIYGGHTVDGSATHNTVTLSGPLNLSLATLYGGWATDLSNSGDLFTGNTLNLNGFSGAVLGLHSFQYLDFLVPPALGNGSTVLTVLGTADIHNSIPGVRISREGTALRSGDTITLIHAGVLLGTPGSVQARSLRGVTTVYDFLLTTTDGPGGTLTATLLAPPRHNVRAKALSEGRLAGLALVNQGADLLAGPGMRAALAAAPEGQPAAFAAGSMGSSRYDSGSHFDLDGLSFLTGLAWNRSSPAARLVLGGFFETGRGNYNTYNSFAGLAPVKGDGDAGYYGGGLFGRLEWQAGKSGLYLEASGRAGRVETHFTSGDLVDGQGREADYDSSSPYYGAHAGLGWRVPVSERAELEFYSQYLWTHEEGDRVTVADEGVRFAGADSQRWRNGARFFIEPAPWFTPYLGAAYEYEFDGKARASAHGLNFTSPGIKGGTGVGELGLAVRPAGEYPLSLDLAAQGYTGVREGAGGSLRLAWHF